MYRKLDDFFAHFDELTEGTRKTFALLEADNLNQAVTSGHRTLGEIAWHIVVTIPEMMSRTGLGLGSRDPHSSPPASATAIVEGYEAVTSELRGAIKSNWTDQALTETDDMYGETWPRGKTLAALIHHEIHHRGQMTTLLRQAGQKVPGLFGPSKEEWKQYGMETPPY